MRDAVARLSGVFNITTTPFDADGAIDAPAFAESVERMLAYGFDGLLIGGTYGEFPAMRAEERALLFRRAVDVAGGRVPVLLCAAGSDLRTVRELTVLASELGGIAMATAPFVSEVTDAHIVGFFRTVAPLSRQGLVVYNAPGIGITLSPTLLERLAEIEGVVGVKQGDLSPTVVDELVGRLKGRIALLCASDLQLLGPLAAGFDGLTSTNSGALPEIVLRIGRALAAGDLATARAAFQSWYPYRALARRFGQPQTVKAAMDARGWRGGSVRPPLGDLGPPEREALAGVLRPLLGLAAAAA
jgi:dihydrodipicolinate synthase/N-acetylneuraminate lyase